ncbi:MAG: hypothetical protein JST39_12340, partial [Bacteroidetes bacterium]|nr:hypothetical protein [Bacteroidota bacterium]
YSAGYRDSTFKISRLKTDWNTYFTQLSDLELNDEHWNREDLSALVNLRTFYLIAGNQLHSNQSTGNPVIQIPSAAIDSMIIQISNGAGQNVNVRDGYLGILSGGPTRTSASDAAVAQLISKGWRIFINTVQQTL